SKRFGRYWLGGFVRYDSLRDAEIEDSPLVSDTESWTGGVALAWVFHER
ncbi:MAG: MipA/OmpV family protein, partial [Gammaproteobacteria bacterium]|nr:MipA/OmpV family protein [Gammaproteobacteria bacterium]